MISKNFVYDFGHIRVDDVHEIYYEQYGNPDGKPILFLHGGPGAGCSTFQRKFFDEKIHRVIFIPFPAAAAMPPLTFLQYSKISTLS